jgi:hypothetical protein
MQVAPMEVIDYSVLTTDEKRVGRVIGTRGGYLIIETGTLKKTRHPLPVRLANVDREKRCVLIQMAKTIVSESPKVAHDGSFDEELAAAYYGE